MTVLQSILHGNVGNSILFLINATAWETLFEKVLQRYYCMPSGDFKQFDKGIKQITLVLLHPTSLNIINNTA